MNRRYVHRRLKTFVFYRPLCRLFRSNESNEMNELYLDIGNSFLKLATPRGNTWKLLYDGRIGTMDLLIKEINLHQSLAKLYVSSVRKDLFNVLKSSLPDLSIRLFGVQDIPRGLLEYDTPGTFGFDRFLVCLGAWSPDQKDVIVIDSGSACTVDLMTSDGVYRGGVIMPGLDLLHGAIEGYLPELPVSERRIPDRFPGKSTEECLEWGVNGTFIAAISGFVQRYRSTCPAAQVYLTGGDSNQLSRWLSGRMEITMDRNLLWEGMKRFRLMAEPD